MKFRHEYGPNGSHRLVAIKDDGTEAAGGFTIYEGIATLLVDGKRYFALTEYYGEPEPLAVFSYERVAEPKDTTLKHVVHSVVADSIITDDTVVVMHPELYCPTCGKGPFESKTACDGHIKGSHGKPVPFTGTESPPNTYMLEEDDPAQQKRLRAEWEAKSNVLDDNEPTGPFWRCEESACGYESYTRPMPKDRAKFYKRVAEHGSPKCPKCKSESFMPVGF